MPLIPLRTLNLTTGADTFTQGLSIANQEITIFALGGDDRINLDRDDDFGGFCRVDAGRGNDVVFSARESGNIILLGTGADHYASIGFGNFASEVADQVQGGAGGDRFTVTTFHSRYFGQGGADNFITVGWQNLFNGGKGFDTISYDLRDDDFAQGGTGVTINLAEGFTQTGAFRQETLVSIEGAIGSGANDALIGSGRANVLAGAGGFDDLTGGAGADRFVFDDLLDCLVSEESFDLIFDFSALEGDRIDLRDFDLAVFPGTITFDFIGRAEFSGTVGELRFDVLSDGILILGDVDGDGAADIQIGAAGLTTISAADFML